MLRLFVSLFIVFIGIAPVMAQTDLSPEQIESLPFSTHGAGTPNTDAIMEEITIDEVEHGDQHGDGGLPQFNTDTFASQIFWLLISFSVLYFFFAKSSLPKLSATIEERLTTIQSDIDQADKLSVEAEETKSSYEEAMSRSHEKARTYVSDTIVALRHDAEKEAQDFKAKSDLEIAKLEQQAESAKEKIKSDLAETAYSLTNDIIQKIAGLTVKDGDIQSAVDNRMDSKTTKKTKKAA